MSRYIFIVFVLFAQVGYSAVCQFKQPAIDTDVCKNLNLDNKVTDNPFFMKNMNGLCGINMQLSGLPDFSLSDYLPNFNVTDVCGAIKYMNGDQVVNQINQFMKT